MANLVERATSDILSGADWALNMELCDLVNRDPGHAKDVVKAVKKRLGNKSPRVQLLTITVLETLIKNCGDVIHHQVAAKDVLHEMCKIAKKTKDMQVKEKILLLLDTWQEAFGGSNGKYPQYFIAYDEMRRAGANFPPRVDAAVPIFTPPQTHPIASSSPSSPRPPRNQISRMETSRASESPGLSLSEMQNARSGVEVLAEMLNAIDPRNRQALEDEVIIELVEQCHIMERRVMQLVSSTSDEQLLLQGLSLNDDLKRVLAKHDSIASGQPFPDEASNSSAPLIDNSEVRKSGVSDSNSTSTRVAKPVKLDLSPPSGLQSKTQPPAFSNAPPASSHAPTIDLLSGDLLEVPSEHPPTAGSQIVSASVLNSSVQRESQFHGDGTGLQTHFLPSLANNIQQKHPTYLQSDRLLPDPSRMPSQQTNYGINQQVSMSSQFPAQISGNNYMAPWSQQIRPMTDTYQSSQFDAGQSTVSGVAPWSQQIRPMTDTYQPSQFDAGQSTVSGGSSLSPQQAALIYGANQQQVGFPQGPQPQVLNYGIQSLPGSLSPQSGSLQGYSGFQGQSYSPPVTYTTLSAQSHQDLSPQSRNNHLPPAPWETESVEAANFPSSSNVYGNVSFQQQTFNQSVQPNLAGPMANLSLQGPDRYLTPGSYPVDSNYALFHRQSIPRKEEKPEDSLFKDLVDLAKTRKGETSGK